MAISEKHVDEIVALYDGGNGDSVGDLAAAFPGFTKAAILYHLKKRGVYVEAKRGKSVSGSINEQTDEDLGIDVAEPPELDDAELGATLEALLSRQPAPEHIIIETSGLALPKPLVKAFEWPDIRNRVTVDGVVTVVDGPAVKAGRFVDDPEKVAAQRAADPSVDHENPLEEVYEDQLLCADLVVLNKADLLSDDDIKTLSDEIKRSIPRAIKIVAAREGAS